MSVLTQPGTTRRGPSAGRLDARARTASVIVLAALAIIAISLTPLGASVAAIDPSAPTSTAPASAPPASSEPSAAPSVTPDPSPVATAAPTAAPTGTPAPPAEPSTAPSAVPSEGPIATPDPSAVPSEGPVTTPDPSAVPEPSPDPAEIPRYPLVLPPEDPSAAPPAVRPAVSPYTSPHVAVDFETDGCAVCHRLHAADAAFVTTEPPPVAGLCFGCHDGSGALVDIKARYDDPGLPANDATTAAWYSHPATVDLGHVPGTPGEFAGVRNRHSTCTDCHSPHRSDDSPSTSTATGWTTSGAERSAAGVRVVNGPALSSPTYTLVSAPTREYQICLKCHSGYTVLPAQDAARPSRWALDKGYELNPANASTHPIEGAGSNATAAMANSLAGGTLWQFGVGDTVRCTNCHGDPLKAGPGATTAAGDRLAPHTSPNRGILIAPYRDRSLKPSGQAYSSAEFELCWLCHAQTPFNGLPGGDAATNFQYHEMHVTGLAGAGGSGTNIDTLGAGAGNAICAECHFRLHSTALAYYPQDRDNTRLVNFAPNVRALGGTLQWNVTATGGACTLICHGYSHDDARY